MNDTYQQLAASAIITAATTAGEEVRTTASEYARPSVVWKPRLYVEGNQWCALLGDNLQDGVSGFGDSPADAMWDFDKQWFAKLPTIEGVPEKKTDQKGQQ